MAMNCTECPYYIRCDRAKKGDIKELDTGKALFNCALEITIRELLLPLRESNRFFAANALLTSKWDVIFSRLHITLD